MRSEEGLWSLEKHLISDDNQVSSIRIRGFFVFLGFGISKRGNLFSIDLCLSRALSPTFVLSTSPLSCFHI